MSLKYKLINAINNMSNIEHNSFILTTYKVDRKSKTCSEGVVMNILKYIYYMQKKKNLIVITPEGYFGKCVSEYGVIRESESMREALSYWKQAKETKEETRQREKEEEFERKRKKEQIRREWVHSNDYHKETDAYLETLSDKDKYEIIQKLLKANHTLEIFPEEFLLRYYYSVKDNFEDEVIRKCVTGNKIEAYNNIELRAKKLI